MNSQKVHVISSSAPAEFIRTEKFENVTKAESQFSSFWSWTFNLSTFLFFILGCPFYLLTFQRQIDGPPVIFATRTWLKLIFSGKFGTPVLILSILLLIPTFVVNAFVAFEIGKVFNSLFIQGEYSAELGWQLIYLLRCLPIVVPLNYIWLRGYKIRKMIQDWDYLYWKYQGYGIASIRVRLRVLLIMVAIFGVNVIRLITYTRHELERDDMETMDKVEIVIEAILDMCINLFIPLYCTFCYAIKFQLLIVKAIIYQWIHQRCIPSLHHLNKIKQLYTGAANNILAVNGMFSLYLSVALFMIVYDTVADSENLGEGLLKMFGGGGIMAIVGMLIKRPSNDPTETEEGDGDVKEKPLTPAEIREINADVAGIVIMYLLIFFMVLQAVATNDTAREINVWLNDFVVGGGGTNVIGVLKELGVDTNDVNAANVVAMPTDISQGQSSPIWAKTTIFEDGTEDEFIKKVK